MKLKFYLVFLLIFFTNLLYAQIRDYVFIVTPVYDEKTLSFMDETAKTLNAKGYKELAAEVTAEKKGGFGSGFLYTSNNKKYVITNRHVVGESSTIDLELEAVDGTKQLFKGNKIIAVDDDLDLAIIEITAKNNFTNGLKIIEKRPEDATDVWTAGYPGLGNTPSWQFGKGVITNSHARIKELVDPVKSDLIQHSAQVDSGNSGGPLLITDKSAVTGYAVVGVNTWKVRSRQAANYSLPVTPALKNFIEKSLATKTVDKDTNNLKEKINDFSKISSIKNNNADPNERMRSIANFISINYVMETGQAALLSALSYAPANVSNEMLAAFEFSVFYGMRFAIAYNIDKKLNDGKNPFAVSAPELQKDTVNTSNTEIVFVAENKETIITAWKEENNTWRLDSVQGIIITQKSDVKESKDKKDPSKLKLDKPYAGIFFIEYDFSFSNHDAIGLGYFILSHKYFGWGSALTISHVSVDFFDTFSSGYDEVKNEKTWSARPVTMARLQLPFKGSSYSITPFIEGSVGVQIVLEFDVIDPPSGVYCSGVGGVQIGFSDFFLSVSGGIEQVVKTFGNYSIDTSETLSGLLKFSIGWGY